ncbi:MAG TPA: rubredoxin, partial [Flavisolibacter sp.]|nr:rubredoxin [Flavisolibacter sp.]
YEDRSAAPLLQAELPPASAERVKNKLVIHQCKHCLTVYVPDTGDVAQGIAAGTGFESLPPDYSCPLCEARKEEFVEVEEEGTA